MVKYLPMILRMEMLSPQPRYWDLCGSSHRTSLNYHSIVCHVPKCRGSGDPSNGDATPTVQCDVCGRGFGSSQAMSTHECHVKVLKDFYKVTG